MEHTYEPTAHGGGQGESGTAHVNVGAVDRAASLGAAAALLFYGLSSRSLLGWVGVAKGAYLAYRGVTGHCIIYDQLRISTAGMQGSEIASIPHNRGIKVEKSVTVNKAPDEVYRFWRDFENLPRFMDHLKSVEKKDPEGRVSHWVAKGPAGRDVEWDAELVADDPNERMVWRSPEGADVDSAGPVRFVPAAGGRGTEVRVVFEYDPPGGRIGQAVAALWGQEPHKQVEDDLRRFKNVIEAGEVPTTTGQASGRNGKD